MSFEPDSLEYGIIYSSYGMGIISLITFFCDVVFKFLNSGELFLHLGYIFLMVATFLMVVKRVLKGPFSPLSKHDLKLVGFGVLAFMITIPCHLFIVSFNDQNISETAHPGQYYYDPAIHGFNADRIEKIEAPLVLLYNGTWMEMPCQWLYSFEYTKQTDTGLWQVLKRDNITRYSEMVERYSCPVPRANMYATKQAALRNSGYTEPKFWEFWRFNENVPVMNATF